MAASAVPGCGSSKYFLDDPDPVDTGRLPPAQQRWTQRLAALPLLHSCFWVCFFAVFSSWGAPALRAASLNPGSSPGVMGMGGGLDGGGAGVMGMGIDAVADGLYDGSGIGLADATSGVTGEELVQDGRWAWAYETSFAIAAFWMAFGALKFAGAVASCFVGLARARAALAVADWRKVSDDDRALRLRRQDVEGLRSRLRAVAGSDGGLQLPETLRARDGGGAGNRRRGTAQPLGGGGGGGCSSSAQRAQFSLPLSPPSHDDDGAAAVASRTRTKASTACTAGEELAASAGGYYQQATPEKPSRRDSGADGEGNAEGDSEGGAEGGAEGDTEGDTEDDASDERDELIRFDDVTHIVVVPNYCEHPSVLARTLDTLADQSVAASSLIVVLAMEGRDPEAHGKASALLAAYGHHFKGAFYTVHALARGEVGGKSSNENWAVRCASKALCKQAFSKKQDSGAARTAAGAGKAAAAAPAAAEPAPLLPPPRCIGGGGGGGGDGGGRGGGGLVDGGHELLDQMLDPRRVVVTTCDADTYFHPQHFAALTAHFVAEPARLLRFWQPLTCFYPNLHEVPSLCRARFTLLSVGFLGQLANPLTKTMPFSCYSLSLHLAQRARFWDPAVIPEDWHMYLRCFYATRGEVSVLPLFIPVGCECVSVGPPPPFYPEPTAESPALPFASAVVAGVAAHAAWWGDGVGACYTQSKRWQWGAVDVGYILVQNALSAGSDPSASSRAPTSVTGPAPSAAAAAAARALSSAGSDNDTDETDASGDATTTSLSTSSDDDDDDAAASPPPAAALEVSASASARAAAAGKRSPISPSPSPPPGRPSRPDPRSRSGVGGRGWLFAWRKAAVLATAYEQHLLYNVMWCALLLAPLVFRNNKWGSWRREVWLAFLLLNWAVLFVLDAAYRALLLLGRRHFFESPAGDGAASGAASGFGGWRAAAVHPARADRPPSRSGDLLDLAADGKGSALGSALSASPAPSALALVWAEAASWAGFRRLMDLALFPLSDVILFVAPTFHAHAAMATTPANAFEYVVAPKGQPNGSSALATSPTSAPASSSASASASGTSASGTCASVELPAVRFPVAGRAARVQPSESSPLLAGAKAAKAARPQAAGGLACSIVSYGSGGDAEV